MVFWKISQNFPKTIFFIFSILVSKNPFLKKNFLVFLKIFPKIFLKKLAFFNNFYIEMAIYQKVEEWRKNSKSFFLWNLGMVSDEIWFFSIWHFLKNWHAQKCFLSKKSEKNRKSWKFETPSLTLWCTCI